MLVALIAFVILLIVGLYLDELQWWHAGLCVLLAVAGAVALVALGWQPVLWTAVLCAIDIVLILVIFKGDITIRG